MASAEHGFKRATIGLVTGLLMSLVVSAILQAFLGETGRSVAVLMNLFVIIIGLMQLERAKYWSLSYIFGYFFGLLVLGRYFMVDWEWTPYMIGIGVYVIQKILRKVRSSF